MAFWVLVGVANCVTTLPTQNSQVGDNVDINRRPVIDLSPIQAALEIPKTMGDLWTVFVYSATQPLIPRWKKRLNVDGEKILPSKCAINTLKSKQIYRQDTGSVKVSSFCWSDCDLFLIYSALCSEVAILLHTYEVLGLLLQFISIMWFFWVTKICVIAGVANF